MTLKGYNKLFGEAHWQEPKAVLYAVVEGAKVTHNCSYDATHEQFLLQFPDGSRLATVDMTIL